MGDVNQRAQRLGASIHAVLPRHRSAPGIVHAGLFFRRTTTYKTVCRYCKTTSKTVRRTRPGEWRRTLKRSTVLDHVCPGRSGCRGRCALEMGPAGAPSPRSPQSGATHPPTHPPPRQAGLAIDCALVRYPAAHSNVGRGCALHDCPAMLYNLVTRRGTKVFPCQGSSGHCASYETVRHVLQ